MKTANTAIREHAKAGSEAQTMALVALGNPEARARELLRPDFCGRIGFPDYELRNNNANIRRMRQRLAGIERAKDAPETVQEGGAARSENGPGEYRVGVGRDEDNRCCDI